MQVSQNISYAFKKINSFTAEIEKKKRNEPANLSKESVESVLEALKALLVGTFHVSPDEGRALLENIAKIKKNRNILIEVAGRPLADQVFGLLTKDERKIDENTQPQ